MVVGSEKENDKAGEGVEKGGEERSLATEGRAMKVPLDRKPKCVEASQVEMKAVVQSEGTARMQAPSWWIDWCEHRQRPGQASVAGGEGPRET